MPKALSGKKRVRRNQEKIKADYEGDLGTIEGDAIEKRNKESSKEGGAWR